MKYIATKVSEFEKKCKGKEIVIFGAGALVKTFLLTFDVQKQIQFVVDNNPKLAGTKYIFKNFKYEICFPTELTKVNKENTVIVIVSTYYKEIMKQLNDMQELDEMECFVYPLFEYDKYSDLFGLNQSKKVMLCVNATAMNNVLETDIVTFLKLCRKACKDVDICLCATEPVHTANVAGKVEKCVKLFDKGVDISEEFLNVAKQMDVVVIPNIDGNTKDILEVIQNYIKVPILQKDISNKSLYIQLNQILNNKTGSGCCGCQACVQACPNNCIHMEYSADGFLYPVIDFNTCIGCRKCVNVCPVENVYYNEKVSEADYYCAYSKDAQMMLEGSSGGVFSLIAEEIIADGGVIYGAETRDGLDIYHSRAESLEEYKKFRKSKYLQSDIKRTYIEAKEDLLAGRKVLFTGTPCQIGGLYTFLGKDYDNLYTIDVICHGVPSKAVYLKYKEALERIFGTKITNMVWRNKERGWKPNYLEIQFEDGERIVEISSQNGFSGGFLSNLYLRKSCYDCKYNRVPRVADISLGDYFWYEGKLKNSNKNQGLSVVVVSTYKGRELFDRIKDFLEYEETTCERAQERNYNLVSAAHYHRKRELFFYDFEQGMLYEELAHKYLDIDISKCKKGD